MQKGQHQVPHAQRSAVEQGLSIMDAMLHTVPEGVLPVSSDQGSSGHVQVVPLLPDWAEVVDFDGMGAPLHDLDLLVPDA